MDATADEFLLTSHGSAARLPQLPAIVERKDKKSLRREAFQPYREACLMGGLG